MTGTAEGRGTVKIRLSPDLATVQWGKIRKGLGLVLKKFSPGDVSTKQARVVVGFDKLHKRTQQLHPDREGNILGTQGKKRRGEKNGECKARDGFSMGREKKGRSKTFKGRWRGEFLTKGRGDLFVRKGREGTRK